MIELMLGDCLKLMNRIEDRSVDLILCDPPYGLTNWCNPTGWDKQLDMGLVWDHLKRVSSKKGKGTTILFCAEPYATKQRLSNPDGFKYDIVWVKSQVSGFVTAKVKPLKTYELISVFSDGTTSPGRKNNMVYNPQGLVRVDKTVKNSKKDRINMAGTRPSVKESYVQEFTGYPKDVLFFDTERGLHPTQKPVPLLEYLIKTYSDKGDTILDFTMGSGSTGVACVNTGRDFIGIEMEPAYFEIAKTRIGNAEDEALV